MFSIIKSLNLEIGPLRVEDVAEKLLGSFGENGKKLGRKIDEKTKDITIKVPYLKK